MAEASDSQIIQALRERPGQTSAEIARKLAVERTTINQRLYGSLRHRVRQDRTYRWHLVEGVPEQTEPGSRDASAQFANTDLAKLARYYLACIGYDDAGVSTLLTSRDGDVDYAEIGTLPRAATSLQDTVAARQLLARKRTDRGRYGVYLGYPTAITRMRSRRSDWGGLLVEPLLLFPVEQEQGSGRMTLDLAFPVINQRPLQAFSNAERDMMMNELVQLAQELGLGQEGELPELDELAMRLQVVREEWPWREPVRPEELGGQHTPIGDITVPGIYNRAVLILAEKSPFTQGLEQELRELARLPEAKYRDTALGRWLRRDTGAASSTEMPPSVPLIEVLPMNLEQRQAVCAALTQPVTVITGPPGTGKSQVVTNLLVNAAWMGKRILFASKNNKAVDVVETRVNALGPRPVLLRVGAQAYQLRLAEYVMALLAATSTTSELADFEEAKHIHERLLQKYQQLDEESAALIALRNDVDRLEQQAEAARRRLQPDLFAGAAEIGHTRIERAVDDLHLACDKADRAKAPLFARIFWRFVRDGRIQLLSTALLAAGPPLGEVGVMIEPRSLAEADIGRIREQCAIARGHLNAIKVAAAYRTQFHALQQARSLEQIARDDADHLQSIARNSGRLWKLWLRLQPSRLTPEQRQQLGRYQPLLKILMEAGDDGELAKTARSEYRKLLREVAPMLPCWAVTSLSARGRIEFEPGVFDLVVFDEASQCDIASALPLLYRAKAVVVIGDAKQLSHISGLPRGQDQALLEKHGLFPQFVEWAYSHQSLFGLAATKVVGESVVSLFDHHRSHADIIGFSNTEFYDQRLRVATRHERLKSPARGEPGVRWIDVKGRAARPSAGGAVNAVEVEAVVEALRDLVQTKRYTGTIGMVTPFRAQANAITEAVNRDDGLSASLMKAEFLADTVHKFQGDERDVMIFSPVVAPGLSDGALGFLRSNPNLFNVAITRARAQVIVVGDRRACGQSGVGYLSRFAEYAESLEGDEKIAIKERFAETGPLYPKVANPELVSDWERVLFFALYDAGLRPIPQYSVEKYILDFVLVENDRRLAIEVDGERYHRNWTGELCRRDQIRNQRLFELGYDVLRFWVYEVRDDIDGCVRRIKMWTPSSP